MISKTPETYSVIVGNVGTVDSNRSMMGAASIFRSYVRLSKENYGRAAGESVTVVRDSDGEPIMEYVGTVEN